MARGLRFLRARFAATALVLVLVSQACGTATVEGDVISGDIKAEFEERTGVEAELVSCPEAVARREGEKFQCTALVGGASTIVDGTMTDDEGAFEWAPTLDVVDGNETAAQIQSELGPEVQVTCDPVVFADPGDPFTCEATEAGGVPTNILVVVEEDGSITWSVEVD